MTDRPILYSAPMVRALLDDTKSQTRRGLSLRGYKGFSEFGRSETPGYDWTFRRADMVWVDLTHAELLAILPFKVGDRLWVHEAWGTLAEFDSLPGSKLPEAFADAGIGEGGIRYNATCPCGAMPSGDGIFGRYRHARFMPRWASRITQTVTDVRVERLQNISEADARAEGASWLRGRGIGYSGWRYDLSDVHADARSAYARLWQSINGPGSWAADPWVIAVTFTTEARNIDQ